MKVQLKSPTTGEVQDEVWLAATAEVRDVERHAALI